MESVEAVSVWEGRGDWGGTVEGAGPDSSAGRPEGCDEKALLPLVAEGGDIFGKAVCLQELLQLDTLQVTE